MPGFALVGRRLGTAGGFLSLAWLVAGCKFGGSVPVTPADFRTASGFLQLQSTSGLSLVANFATLAVHLIQPAAAGDAGSLPAPLPKFKQVYVTAVSAEAGGAVLDSTVGAEKVDDRGRSVEPILSRMPPSTDVAVRVYLMAEDGRLVGSGVVEHATIRPGPNNLDVAIAANTQPPFLVGASDSINVSDNVIVKGATLAVSTGVLKEAPGVARVEVEVTGDAYGDGKLTAQLASLTPPALDQFQWRPLNPSGTYDPEKLAANKDKAPFSLVTRAFDPFDHLVGTASLKLDVIGTAYVDVGVEPGAAP